MTRICSRVALAAVFTAALVLAQPGAPVPQQLVFTPYHASGIYDVGEMVGWTVTPSPVESTYSYKWTIRRNNAVVLKEGTLDLSSGKDKIETTGDEPAMLYVAIEPVAKRVTDDAAATPEASAPTSTRPGRGNPGGFVGGNTGRNNGRYAVGAAVAPTKIGLAAARPDDFDSFWDGKLAAQAKVPMNPVLTPVQTEVPGVEMSAFAIAALGSKAQGYIAKPAKEGKFPALGLLLWAGVYALSPRPVAERAAGGWLGMDVDPHDKLPSDPFGNIPRNYPEVDRKS